jgi:hypothetical protein
LINGELFKEVTAERPGVAIIEQGACRLDQANCSSFTGNFKRLLQKKECKLGAREFWTMLDLNFFYLLCGGGG